MENNEKYLDEILGKNEQNYYNGTKDLIIKQIKQPINKRLNAHDRRLKAIEQILIRVESKLDKMLEICEISMSENEKEALKAEYIQKLKELGVEVK